VKFMKRKTKFQNNRAGAAAVEFAMIAPLFILMFFGIVEFGRGMMVQQVIIQASREGAREASLPDATLDSVKDIVQEFAEKSGVTIKRDDIAVTPNPASATNNEQITVEAEVAVSDVSWIPRSFLPASLRASTTMRSESLN
jgi:Flp pilus assembly protein TadG